MFVIFSSLEEAEAYQLAVDGFLGFPRSVENSIEGLEPVVLEHWGSITKHDSLSIWAHPFNDNFEAETVPELDSGWYPKSMTPSGPNWDALSIALRGSMIFGKAYMLGNPNAFSLLLTTLQTTHVLVDLEWALAQVRASMRGYQVDFTPEEIAWLNDLLATNNIPLVLV